MGDSTVTELVDFTGGMNTLVAPHLIDRREALSLVNVDIRLGTLQSMPNLQTISPLVNGGFFYQFNDNVYDFDEYRNNITWDNKYYWSDRFGVGKMLADGTILPLGVPTPAVSLTQVKGLAGIHTGDFKYTYTFYSTETGVESAPAPLPIYVTVSDNTIKLSGFEGLPANTNRYRLYRIGGYFSLFTLVATLEAADVAVEYIDDIDDSSVDGRLLETLMTNPPPDGLENLTELNGRFYGSVGNKGYYSALGNPDAWYVSNYFVFKEDIMAIATSPAGLLIMGYYYTHLLAGNDPTNYVLKELSNQLGCVGKESVASIGDSSIWLSHKAFVMCNGYSIVDITARKIDNLRNLTPTSACVEDQTYYISYLPTLVPLETLYPSEKLLPSKPEGVSEVDRGIIAIDFKRGDGFSYKLINYKDIVSVGIVDGDVFVGAGSPGSNLIPCDSPLFVNCNDFLRCSEFSLDRMNVYKSQGRAELRYESPVLIEGSAATIKQYDKVWISFNGIFKVSIYFDDRLIIEDDIASEGFADTIIGIPNSDNSGYGIKFKIVGIGSISAIQYSWKARERVT